jgi:hypothetical protein
MIELDKWQTGFLAYLAAVFLTLWFFNVRQKRPDGREDFRQWTRGLGGIAVIFAGIFALLKLAGH